MITTAGAALPADARCGVHPERAAAEVCRRCGRFLCDACTERQLQHAYCEPCFERAVRGPASGRALGATAASMLSVVLLFYASVILLTLGPKRASLGYVFFALLLGPAVVGLGLAYSERGRIDRGDAGIRGQIYADAAVIMGWVAMVGFVVVAAIFLLATLG